jgi:hypothetical protein
MNESQILNAMRFANYKKVRVQNPIHQKQEEEGRKNNLGTGAGAGKQIREESLTESAYVVDWQVAHRPDIDFSYNRFFFTQKPLYKSENQLGLQSVFQSSCTACYFKVS